jgi:hypothetical protein
MSLECGFYAINGYHMTSLNGEYCVVCKEKL